MTGSLCVAVVMLLILMLDLGVFEPHSQQAAETAVWCFWMIFTICWFYFT